MRRSGGGGLAVNVVLALLSIALVLGAAELAVRLFVGPVAPRNLTRVPASLRAPAPVPGIPYLLEPGAVAKQVFPSNPRGYFDAGATLTYRINARGFRSPPFEVEKPPGVFRILGLGDSITFGAGVRSEHAFLSRLRDALEAEAPGRYEVLNLGVMGYNTAHEVRLLEHRGLRFEPDLVVLCYVLNDARVPPQRRHAPRLPAGERLRRFLGGRLEKTKRSPSWLVDHLRRRVENRRAARETIESTHRDYAPGAEGWLRVQRALQGAAAFAREHDFALVLMIFPHLWELDDGHPFADLHAQVADAARRSGIPVLDLLDAFRGEDGPSLWVHPANQHPNERAHAIAAEALHGYLRARGLLATPPSRAAAPRSAAGT